MPVTVQAVLAARIDRLDPDAKHLLQVASVVGKEVSGEALGLTAGLDDEAIEPALGELIEAGFLYEAELYPRAGARLPPPADPRGRLRHPARRAAGGDPRGGGAGADRARPPERHDELAALIADHMEQGGETLEAARWSARAAYWAGHSRPRDALRLWHEVIELADRAGGERGDRRRWRSTRGCCSCSTPGGWG